MDRQRRKVYNGRISNFICQLLVIVGLLAIDTLRIDKVFLSDTIREEFASLTHGPLAVDRVSPRPFRRSQGRYAGFFGTFLVSARNFWEAPIGESNWGYGVNGCSSQRPRSDRVCLQGTRENGAARHSTSPAPRSPSLSSIADDGLQRCLSREPSIEFASNSAPFQPKCRFS